jgi:cobyrinic acid a,c-diamide synthase
VKIKPSDVEAADAPALQRCPGLIIAALRGGSGKTIFSVGIIAALRNRGIKVAPFKKGPDYIDAGWLALAAGRPCYNLDTFLIDSEYIFQSYQTHTHDAGLAVIEGNRGLYDCIDTQGQTSTAELAKQLDLPVILCLDGTKTTRTMAAVVAGCAQFDPKVKLKGVVLNRVAGPRHENILRTSIEEHCGIPVLGAVPKLRKQSFPERHMGLVPTYEHQWAQDAKEAIADLAERYLDLDAIFRLAASDLYSNTAVSSESPQAATSATDLYSTAGVSSALISSSTAVTDHVSSPLAQTPERPRIGVVRDSAFQFYYPENLDALIQAGAEVVITSPLFEDNLPAVDGLYIGGGFPETHAQRLSKNITYRNDIKRLAEKGLPIYAECGGLMFLGRELVLEEGTFPMADVLPVSFGFSKRPQGHGYTILNVVHDNPFFEAGQTIKGHEFHYSTVEQCTANETQMAFKMARGTGLQNGFDGLCRHNALATYTHIHALGTPQWAPALVAKARAYGQSRTNP